MQIAPPSSLAFEVTFDSDALDVGMTVYDVTGDPGLVLATFAMANIYGNSYVALFTPLPGHNYLIHKAVYTDGTLATIDTDYGQSSETIFCPKQADIFTSTGIVSSFLE